MKVTMWKMVAVTKREYESIVLWTLIFALVAFSLPSTVFGGYEYFHKPIRRTGTSRTNPTTRIKLWIGVLEDWLDTHAEVGLFPDLIVTTSDVGRTFTVYENDNSYFQRYAQFITDGFDGKVGHGHWWPDGGMSLGRASGDFESSYLPGLAPGAVDYYNRYNIHSFSLTLNSLVIEVHEPFVSYDVDATFTITAIPEAPRPPVADSGGPYSTYVGYTLTLDASGSTDADDDIVSYIWDLDDDGSFETDSGNQAVFLVNYAYLESIGLIADNVYKIHVQVTDSKGQSDVADSTLTIVGEQAIIYVDTDAMGNNDGASWADAFNYLQDALARASSGDQIRVAAGVYKPDEDTLHHTGTGDRMDTFQMITGVAIKGGYAGFGEPDPNARDIKEYETILSGDLNGDDGPDFANNGENSYHVVKGSGTNATAVMDGFTITAGNANSLHPEPLSWGGGMLNESGSPIVTHCTFSRNWAYDGGGMANCLASRPTVTNCTFSNNTAFSSIGGGMYNVESNPTLTNCAFTGNYARRGGGVGNSYSNPTLNNCAFTGNSGGSGGGVSNDHSNPTLTNCTFTNNSTSEAGGVRNYFSNPILTNCTFSGNSAMVSGGGDEQ